MSRNVRCGLLVAMLCALPGCPGLGFLTPTRTVTVNLINHSDFAVDVDLFISDEQDIPEDLLVSLGEKIEFTIPAGQTRSFSRECDELQALIVSDADLMVIGQVGPSTDTNVLRDGTQFNCDDTIDLTFDHTPLLVDFAITVNVHQ